MVGGAAITQTDPLIPVTAPETALSMDNPPLRPALEPTMLDFLAVIHDCKWLVLFLVTLAVLLTYVWSAQAPRLYENALALDLPAGEIEGALGLLHSDRVLAGVRQPASVDLSQLHITRLSKKRILIAYQAGDPTQAAAVPVAIVQGYLQLVHRNRLEATPIETRLVGSDLLRNTTLACLFTFLLATTCLMLFQVPEIRLRSLVDLEAISPVPVLGVLPRSPRRNQARRLPVVVDLQRSKPHESLYANAIRALCDTIDPAIASGKSRAILVASPLPGEGRSTVAANLAAGCASLGKKVLLVDADVRKPRLYQAFFGTRNLVGLSQVIPGDRNWQEVVVKASPHLDLLPGVTALECEPSTELSVGLLMRQARSRYDIIILDSPSFLHNPENVDLARAADSVVVVARRGKTSEAALVECLGYLKRLRIRVMGTVFNQG